MAAGRLMPWPVPALLAWALAWAVFFGLRAWGLPMLLSLPLATLAGLLCALPAASRWRQVFIAGGKLDLERHQLIAAGAVLAAEALFLEPQHLART